MDGNIYNQFGEVIDRRLGGVRAEAQRRAAAGPQLPAMFRLWQEKVEPPIGEEKVGSDEEVVQRLLGRSKKKDPLIIEAEDENEQERTEPPSVLYGRLEDLLDKIGRYQQKLVGLCEEVKRWKSSIPQVFLYDSGLESAPARPEVNMVGSCPQSGMRGRPLTTQTRLAQAARTRNQARVSASQEPSRKGAEPGKRKEAVEVEDDDNDDEEEEDERLRREEDQKAEQRARKKGTRGEVEPVVRDGPPKRKKYAVWLEEGFDVEKVIDRLLEGHNDLMTLKEILASAPRLRNELKWRLSRRLVPNVHLGTILPQEAEWSESGTKMDWKQKRKERDATASGTPGVTRIVTDVLAQLGYATEPVVQRRVVTAVKVKGKEPVIEEAVQEELWEEEEPVPQHLTKVQRKVRNLAQGGQGSGKAQAPQTQAAAPLNVAAPSSSTGPSQGGALSYGQWPWPVINAIVPWGSPPPVAGPQTSMPPPIYPAAQAQPVAPLPSPDPSSQGSVVGGGSQGQGNQDNGGRGGGRGRGRNGGGRGRQWNDQGQGYQGQGGQGQGYQGQGSEGHGYQGQGSQGQGNGMAKARGTRAKRAKARDTKAKGVKVMGTKAKGVKARGTKARAIKARGIKARGIREVRGMEDPVLTGGRPSVNIVTSKATL
ncbi:hypothetical protein CBR_g50563 [Chara braunii]|uniref:Uncharacterized protein n=1 Tax=Chara braunii TaxID=69332 RepID=A0A388M6U5_CHABU|nr:hypothetical protein CBR_g50563 [Chara braunii]|eukprot:GBG90314.1 hypothetical protein CBR_g50563 [Chara braunii]